MGRRGKKPWEMDRPLARNGRITLLLTGWRIAIVGTRQLSPLLGLGLHHTRSRRRTDTLLGPSEYTTNREGQDCEPSHQKFEDSTNRRSQAERGREKAGRSRSTQRAAGGASTGTGTTRTRGTRNPGRRRTNKGRLATAMATTTAETASHPGTANPKTTHKGKPPTQHTVAKAKGKAKRSASQAANQKVGMVTRLTARFRVQYLS